MSAVVGGLQFFGYRKVVKYERENATRRGLWTDAGLIAAMIHGAVRDVFSSGRCDARRGSPTTAIGSADIPQSLGVNATSVRSHCRGQQYRGADCRHSAWSVLSGFNSSAVRGDDCRDDR